jgi:hypothetical protein
LSKSKTTTSGKGSPASTKEGAIQFARDESTFLFGG